MKKSIFFVVLLFLLVACSEKAASEKQSVEKYNVPSGENAASAEYANPSVDANGAQPMPGAKFAPPKPVTKGAFDFSECKEKYVVGTEDYKNCVKAKYPNAKFAGE